MQAQQVSYCLWGRHLGSGRAASQRHGRWPAGGAQLRAQAHRAGQPAAAACAARGAATCGQPGAGQPGFTARSSRVHLHTPVISTLPRASPPATSNGCTQPLRVAQAMHRPKQVAQAACASTPARGGAGPPTRGAGAAAAAGLQQRDSGAELAVLQGGIPPGTRHLCTGGGPAGVLSWFVVLRTHGHRCWRGGSTVGEARLAEA